MSIRLELLPELIAGLGRAAYRPRPRMVIAR
jgi:hypothetical protein